MQIYQMFLRFVYFFNLQKLNAPLDFLSKFSRPIKAHLFSFIFS